MSWNSIDESLYNLDEDVEFLNMNLQRKSFERIYT